jgi:NADH-quinone oxidoreductase subunit G
MVESEGLYYAYDGQSQAAEAATSAAGDSRPGWKILRRLGGELELEGFSQVDLKALREEVLSEIGAQDEAAAAVELPAPGPAGDLHRVGELAMYAVDGLCRRSDFLQKTAHAETAFAGLNPNDAGSRGFVDGAEVRVSQGGQHVNLPVRICEELPAGAVWVKTATLSGRELGDSFGPISVEAS